MADPRSWWMSSREEGSYSGPFDTREEAIGEIPDGEVGFIGYSGPLPWAKTKGGLPKLICAVRTIESIAEDVTGDPPYAQDERADNLYACETNVSAAVREWALEHGDDPLMRIVLCGYEGEHDMPDTWRVAEWKAAGGYGRAEGAKNRFRERLWFSPYCLSPNQKELFA